MGELIATLTEHPLICKFLTAPVRSFCRPLIAWSLGSMGDTLRFSILIAASDRHGGRSLLDGWF